MEKWTFCVLCPAGPPNLIFGNDCHINGKNMLKLKNGPNLVVFGLSCKSVLNAKIMVAIFVIFGNG